MTIETTRLRQLLSCFPTGVAVVTTRDPYGHPVGLTCNSFSSVSLDPPLVLFSLRSASRLLESFRQSPSFAINILSQHQDGLSRHFASSKVIDKFVGIDWCAGTLDAPVIDRCLASFECATHAHYEVGDHWIFIGEIKHMSAGAGDQALVFYKGTYMMLAESISTLVLQGKLGHADIDEAYRTLYGALLRQACTRASDSEIDAIEAAAQQIEQQDANTPLPQRIDSASRFFSTIAAAGHNASLLLMAQTMSSVLRERMTHVLPVRLRPELFPLRRKIVLKLRQRDPQGSEQALDELIVTLRRGDGMQGGHEKT